MMQIGIDFGGTKIEGAALDDQGEYITRVRVPNPGNYDRAVSVVRDLVVRLETETSQRGSVGIGTPGSISPTTGLMRNSNSLYLNGRRFREDLCQALKRPVRLANDANCFALSEATDGAGADGKIVFGVIMGTGCGGGVVVGGRLLEGRNAIAGEWGHNPLPWPAMVEAPGPACYCGKHGCLEQWISGTGLQRDFAEQFDKAYPAEQIIAMAKGNHREAQAAFERLVDRTGRALASVCNLIDPDVIVIGGGLSNVRELYEKLPAVISSYVFSDAWSALIRPAKWGDASGVRGAARLWQGEDANPLITADYAGAGE